MWNSRVPDVPKLKSAITNILSSVLVLCGLYTKYIQKKARWYVLYSSRIEAREQDFIGKGRLANSSTVKAFRTLVSGEDSDLKDAHNRFRKAVQYGRDIIQNATLQTVHQTREQMENLHIDVKKTLSSVEHLRQKGKHISPSISVMPQLPDGQSGNRQLEEGNRCQLTANYAVHARQNTLDWFSHLNYREHQREAYAKYHQGTGRWMLESAPFQSWVNSPSSKPVMWCPGDRKISIHQYSLLSLRGHRLHSLIPSWRR